MSDPYLTNHELIARARTAASESRRHNLDPDDTPALLVELADRLEAFVLDREDRA